MKNGKNCYYRTASRHLGKKAKLARTYVNRICAMLSEISGRKFYAEMSKFNNDYEGHIIDSGKYVEVDPAEGTCVLSDAGTETVGMIFFGGHFSLKKHRDALSKAWISLLEDCIGNAENGKISDFHNLTDHLKEFGPEIDLNCKTVERLEELLKLHEC